MKITGLAEVAGIGTIALTHATLGSNSALGIESLDAGHQWAEDVTKDPSTGKPVTILCNDEVKELTVTGVFRAAATGVNNTKAIAAGAAVYPEPNAVVTIASATPTALNATYLYKGGQWKFAPGGKAQFTMRITRYVECNDAEHTSLGTQVG